MSDFFADLLRATSHGLVLPREDEDAINRYVAMHANDRTNVESRPFPRQVDFWAFCIATALALKLEPRDGPTSRWGKSFIYTSQGIVDNDLASLLAIVAVAKIGLDDPEVTESRRIIELANRLAAAACPRVLHKLQNSPLRTTPLDQALEFARSLQEQVYDDS
ncbi:MAG: hypothetical protein F4229_08505 [Gammaproteobacteria bacterium]|nr:hypothetical protein [Gammaproteobacteria bacterium]